MARKLFLSIGERVIELPADADFSDLASRPKKSTAYVSPAWA